MRFIDELKRRNVFRVGAAYVLLGWLVVQVTDTVAPALNLPEWTLGFVTWVGIIGLPFALFFAWAYELTPDGIRREENVDRAESTTQSTGRKLDVALIGLLIVAIGFIAWDSAFRETARHPGSTGTPQPADSAQQAAESIAVLPLINMSALSDNAFFAGGVHEEILTNLSRIEGLRVVSRTTALRYVNSDLSLRDIGRELGVRYIVEGSVRRINDHVRITVQLIDAVDDAHLWASNYDRQLVDVFATQSEVAREITNSLHLEIQPETVGTLDDMPTRSVKAYDLYLKAKSIDRSEYQTEDSLQRQRDLLEAAVAEDPNFVEAWGFLNEMLDEIARNIIQNAWFGETQAERDAVFAEVRRSAQRALDKAVALGPDNIETLMAQASDFAREQNDGVYRRERRQFIDRALELDPDNAHAWYVLAWWHRIEGDYDAATETFLKALELDPLHARFVTGSLLHFRATANQEMTRQLYARLTQIAPEKREDTKLGEIPMSARLGNLMALFGETADPSVMERYAAEFAEAAKSDLAQWERVYYEIPLLAFQNDLDALAALSLDDLPDNASFDQALHHHLAQDSILAAQIAAGRTDDAAATARAILANEYRFPGAGGLEVASIDRLKLRANAVLGNRINKEQISSAHGDIYDETFENTAFGPLATLALIDTDWIVDQLIEMKSRYPSWFGTDVVAIDHVSFRHVVTHPKMQAFYVEEDKWIDYLATRVPEYAQYRR